MKIVKILELDDIKPGLKLNQVKDQNIFLILGHVNAEKYFLLGADKDPLKMWFFDSNKTILFKNKEEVLIALNEFIIKGMFEISKDYSTEENFNIVGAL